MTNQPSGLRFTERMTGWCAPAPTCEAGAVTGKRAGSAVTFKVTVQVPDVDALVRDASLVSTLTGYIEAPELFTGRAEIYEGAFQLMVHCPDQVETSNMRYEIDFETPDKTRMHLSGFKVLNHAPIRRMWPATTTLYVTITKALGTGDAVVARGIMRIKPRAFLRQLTTFRASPRLRPWRSARTIARFAKGFIGRLVPLYAGEFDESARFARPLPVPHRRLQLPEEVRMWRGANNEWNEGRPGPDNRDANLMLTNYRGGDKGPLILAPGFGMEAHAFAIPTVKCTLAEYAVARGYDVWLFDYRASIALPTARSSFTLDDVATDDWPAAVARVRECTGKHDVQILGHCVGSVTLLMAVLAGMEGVRSLVCSQFQIHWETSGWNKFKARVRVTSLLRAVHWRVMGPDNKPTWFNKLIDAALAPLPIPKGERCGLPMCRWINAIYGLTHHHAQLNDATHEAINSAFGFANVRGLAHMGLMARKRHAVDHDGGETYLANVIRLGLPILFIQGDKNYIFHPEGMQNTLNWLQPHRHELTQELRLPDYAHLDTMIGKRAYLDVFPQIFDHLDGVTAAVA